METEILSAMVNANSPSSTPIAPALIQTAVHLQASKYFQVASGVILLYDHLITFGQEVEQIWCQPWSGATLLFALIRYLSTLQRPIITVAFLSAAWSHHVSHCTHFVRFSGASTVVIVGVAEIIMGLRVWALWHKSKRVLFILSFLWAVQVAFTGMALGFSKRVPLPPFLVGCILTGENSLFTPTWLMPLFTDSAIFGLTLLRVLKYSNETKKSAMLKVFIRDGALYFFCIFSANLLNTILFIAATEDLKAIGAGFSQVLTSIMVTRLVLNLRMMRHGHGSPPCTEVNQKVSRIDQFIGALGEEPCSEGTDMTLVGSHDSTSQSWKENELARYRLSKLRYSSSPTSPRSPMSSRGLLSPASPFSPMTPISPRIPSSPNTPRHYSSPRYAL